MPRKWVLAVGAVVVAGGAYAIVMQTNAPPALLLDSARAGLGTLREADAGQWAPEELATAEAALDAAEDEVARQRLRFAPVRRFARAEVMLQAAVRDIDLARVAAREGRRVAEEEAREAMGTAKDAIEGARTALLLAPVSSARRRSFDHLEEALDEADTLYQETEALVLQGDFRQATRRAESILGLISARVRAVHDGNG